MGWLFNRYVCECNTFDFAVKSVSYYKETDLATGASLYFTEVTVSCTGWSPKDTCNPFTAIDLRLALNDGTVIDTSWSCCCNYISPRQTFEFKTQSAPAYAQLDPQDKFPGDTNYADNSLTVSDFLAPVVKWAGRIFYFFQNLLLSSGVLA